MKDPERMDKEEKRRYIFEDTSFENRTRVNWITDCLLGDIRTFLDGIEHFIIQNEGKLAEKSLRGGGNLSVPILISTALEFVSALYVGKTDDQYMKFKIPKREFVGDINNGILTDSLKSEFKNRKLPLPENPTVTTINKDKEWSIKDANTRSIYYVVSIIVGENKLLFHFLEKAEYNGTDNVKGFIKEFFPKEYREIPLLLWDGIRNGLIHTFSPKPFKYKGSYIRFQFYVEDQNFPSHIEKSNNTILIRVSVFELYRVLEKSVEAYLTELENSAVLQNKFVRAWSSIEDYKRVITSDQKEKSKEVEALFDYLDSNSSALLLKGLNDQLSVDVLKIYSLCSLKIKRS